MDTVLIYILVSAFTPGPSNVMSSTITMRTGFLKTIPFMLGVLVGTFFVFILSGIVNVILIDHISILTKYISYIGTIYIMYLTYKIVGFSKLDTKIIYSKKSLFFKAVLLAFTNPKVIIFGLTSTGLYFRWGIHLGSLIILSSALALLCFGAVIFWSFIGYMYQKYFSKYSKVFNISMASLLVFSALLILLDTL